MAEETSAGVTETGADQPAEPPPADLDALLAVIRARHPQLDEPGIETVRRVLLQSRQMAAALDAFPLSNADEPDPILIAYRAD